MILYDGIITSLQATGGVSILFNELIKRMSSSGVKHKISIFDDKFCHKLGGEDGCILQSPRLLERYRDAIAPIEYDIFHSTYYRLPQGGRGKIVTTVHDYTYERYRSNIAKWIHSVQKNRAIKHSDIIICVSESTRQDLIEYSGSSYEDRTVVIHNGASDEYKILKNIIVKPQIIFVGSRSGYKNFKSLVYAISPLKGIDLVCVGGGNFTREEVQLLENYLPLRCRHLGFLTNKELNIEYNQSLCFVYPSLYEGFGIPVLEAMRSGCPVVAVNCSSIPEVAGNAALLLEVGDPFDIRQAIESFMVTETREKYISRGIVQSEKFSWDKTYSETISVYDKLLGL
jgi:mannosyltransferase